MPNYELYKAAMVNATRGYWDVYVGETTDSPSEDDAKAKRMNDRTGTPERPSSNCVALARYPKEKLPYVAMNEWVEEAARAELGAKQYTVVQDTTIQLHAEMKLMDYFDDEKPKLPDYVAIALPCCLRCAVAMKILKVKTRGTSKGIWAAGWKFPTAIVNHPDRLNTFIGGDVANIPDPGYLGTGKNPRTVLVRELYAALSDNQKADFRGLLETVPK